MSRHNTNAMKGRRVAAAENEAYDKIARALLTKEGFDLDDVNKKCNINGFSLTPMIHFSRAGNLQMCRYLLSRGADCRKTNTYGDFPLFVAAAGGHLEIVRFLSHDGGAHEDIRRVTREGYSPLRVALFNDHFDVVQWLILNGAIFAPLGDVNGGGIHNTTMRRDLRQEIGDNWPGDKRLTVLSWAQHSIAAYENVKLFLTGTIVSVSSVRRHSNNSYATRGHKRMKIVSPSSPLVIFKGKSGILELIAHYIAGTPQQLRTLRQLVDRLPALIADVPFVIEEEDSDDDSDDEWDY